MDNTEKVLVKSATVTAVSYTVMGTALMTAMTAIAVYVTVDMIAQIKKKVKTIRDT